VVVELARTIEPRELRRTVLWMLFDGEESPAGVPDSRFLETGLRGSRVAARELRGKARRARAMILLDFVGDRDLSLPRERASDPDLWAQLRRAARAVGHADVFPRGTRGPIADDHYPFIERGIAAIDLIDFDFPCWHRSCDDLSAVSQSSLEAAGESVYELLRRL
jgi:Zn-dependent M28 family amino/carboxypeptidase